MLNTHVRSAWDLRNNYAELADIVQKEDHVIITNNGKSESVLISFNSFKKYEEFLHDRYIDEKSAEADVQANAPNTEWLTNNEVFGNLRERYGL